MIRIAISACLLVATSSVFAQTAMTKSKTAVHHTTAAAPIDSAESNAPGVPKAAGAVETLYALRYVDLVIGTGDLAEPRKWYTVNYTGWLKDGTKFDSSVDRNQPFTFPYGAHRVITGWDTGFEGMRVGGKRRLIVPYALAYGEVANGKIPAESKLIFDVELLGMSDTPPPAPKPAAPPADAAPQSTLSSKVIPANPGAAPGAGTPGTVPETAPATPGGTPQTAAAAEQPQYTQPQTISQLSSARSSEDTSAEDEAEAKSEEINSQIESLESDIEELQHEIATHESSAEELSNCSGIGAAICRVGAARAQAEANKARNEIDDKRREIAALRGEAAEVTVRRSTSTADIYTRSSAQNSSSTISDSLAQQQNQIASTVTAVQQRQEAQRRQEAARASRTTSTGANSSSTGESVSSTSEAHAASSSSSTSSGSSYNSYSGSTNGYNSYSGSGTPSGSANGYWTEEEHIVTMASIFAKHSTLTMALVNENGDPSPCGSYVLFGNADSEHEVYYGFAGVINEKIPAGATMKIRWPAPYAQKGTCPSFAPRVSIRYFATQ